MATPELFVRGLQAPGGIAFNAEEDLFVAETESGAILRLSSKQDRKELGFLAANMFCPYIY